MNLDNGFIVSDYMLDQLVKSLKDKPLDTDEYRHIPGLENTYISLASANDPRGIFQEMFAFTFAKIRYSVSFCLIDEN